MTLPPPALSLIKSPLKSVWCKGLGVRSVNVALELARSGEQKLAYELNTP